MKKKPHTYKVPQDATLIYDLGKVNLDDLEANLTQAEKLMLPRLQLIKDNSEGVVLPPTIINSSSQVVQVMRDIIGHDLNIREQAIVLLLNSQNKVIGYYRVGMGSRTSTLVDPTIIAMAAVKSGATSVIQAHNHPSGALVFSEADKRQAKKLYEALKLLDITLLDSMVVTNQGYVSMQEEGLLGLGSVGGQDKDLERRLRSSIHQALKWLTPANSPVVYQAIQTEKGYLSAEKAVLNLVLTQALAPSAAVAQLEIQWAGE